MSKINNFLLLGISAFFALIAMAQAEPFRVGFFENSPHVISDKENGAKGPAVEYFRLIAKQIGITDIFFEELPMARLLSYLKTGKSDAALILAKTPERAETFVYPKEPFFKIQGAIVVKNTNALAEIKSVNDILPLRINAYAKAYLSTIMLDKRLNIIPVYGYETDVNEESFKMIIGGMSDAFYSPDLHPLQIALRRGGYESNFKILMLPEPPIDIFTVFSKQSAGKYLKKYEDALNEQIKIRSYEEELKDFIKDYK